MGYNIRLSYDFELPNNETYHYTYYFDANITYNIREMIIKATGLENWSSEADLGLAKDVIEKIAYGYDELINNKDEYRKYDSPNGWGTVDGCINFFNNILKEWNEFREEDRNRILAKYVHFEVC